MKIRRKKNKEKKRKRNKKRKNKRGKKERNKKKVQEFFFRKNPLPLNFSQKNS